MSDIDKTLTAFHLLVRGTYLIIFLKSLLLSPLLLKLKEMVQLQDLKIKSLEMKRALDEKRDG